MTSQTLESYVPVYDVVPEDWEDARQFLVETLRKITDNLNVKEIGYYLNEELLSGAQFIGNDTTPQQYRSIYRKVIPTGALIAGANAVAHGINFDSNFTLIKLYASGTDTVGFVAQSLMDAVDMDATNINITSPTAFDKGYAVVEYLLEG